MIYPTKVPPARNHSTEVKDSISATARAPFLQCIIDAEVLHGIMKSLALLTAAKHKSGEENGLQSSGENREWEAKEV